MVSTDSIFVASALRDQNHVRLAPLDAVCHKYSSKQTMASLITAADEFQIVTEIVNVSGMRIFLLRPK